MSVIVSPRKATSVTADVLTPVPQCTLPNNRGTPKSEAVGGGDDPFVDVGYIATHLRRAVLDLPPSARYCIPHDITSRFPPTLSYGWRKKKWYIVWHGHEVGIFYDMWWATCCPPQYDHLPFSRARVHPLIKDITDAGYKGCQTLEDANRLWNERDNLKEIVRVDVWYIWVRFSLCFIYCNELIVFIDLSKTLSTGLSGRHAASTLSKSFVPTFLK